MDTLNKQIEQAATLIQKAQNIVAMTGAGISTPSGIPDFRSPNSGLWNDADPLTVVSIETFRRQPQQFYNWVRPLVQQMMTAEPNPAHYALVTLEQQGKIKAIVTQNIDNLHCKAGSKIVYELHGHLRDVTCTRCYKVQSSEIALAKFLEDGQVPHCSCGGVFKPNIIFFGEQLPMREFTAAQMAIKTADLMLVVGSSLEVAPASNLPLLGLDNKAKLIIINYQPTYLDDLADVVIHADVAEVLPQILDFGISKLALRFQSKS